ncbi:hypothetical protein NQD34_003373 [Periophthalmus magnuspinnatus]|nr:hypothetical protein NQD34_003373 [Periophthalmus magnuspinnatus]
MPPSSCTLHSLPSSILPSSFASNTSFVLLLLFALSSCFLLSFPPSLFRSVLPCTFYSTFAQTNPPLSPLFSLLQFFTAHFKILCSQISPVTMSAAPCWCKSICTNNNITSAMEAKVEKKGTGRGEI